MTCNHCVTRQLTVLFKSFEKNARHLVDLAEDVPLEANAIDVMAAVVPSEGAILVFRSPVDDDPVQMGDGARTIFGVPKDRQLFVEMIDGAECFEVTVLEWLP